MNKIPEERMPAILKRAAELDRATITVDSIRVAAIEAGISATAVDQAIQEFANSSIIATEEAPVVAKPRLWKRLVQGAANVLKIVAFTGFVGALGSEAEALVPLTFLAWAFVAFRLARGARPNRAARRFQIINVAITFGLFMGTLMFNAEDLAISYLILGVGVIAAGTMYIQFRWNEWLHETPESNKA